MNNFKVDWGSLIQWASFYRRNNKTGAIKNVQCFPDHYNGDAGFCGQSILIRVVCDKSLLSTIHIVGEFCLEENAKKRFPVGSSLAIEEYESNKKNHTFFTGVLEKQEDDNQLVNCIYEINKELRGWHYGWTASRHRQDIDHVFIIHVFNLNQSKYDSIGILYSPSFQIKCSRRVTTFIESRNTPKAFKKMLPKPYNPNEKYNQFIPHNKDNNDNQECLYDGLNRDIHDEPSTRYSIPLTSMNINEISIHPPPPLTKTITTATTITSTITTTPNTAISNKSVVVRKKINQKRKIDKNNSLLVYASQNNHKKKMKVLKPPPLIPKTSLSQSNSPLDTDHKMVLDIKSEPPSPISLPPSPLVKSNSDNNNYNYNNKMLVLPDNYYNKNIKPPPLIQSPPPPPQTTVQTTSSSTTATNTTNILPSNIYSPSVLLSSSSSSTLNSPSNLPSRISSPTIPLYCHFSNSLCLDTNDLTYPPQPPPPPPSTTPPPYLHSLHSPPPLSLLPSRSISPTIEPCMIYDGPVLSDEYADSHSFVPLPPPALSPLLQSSSSASSIFSTNSDTDNTTDGREESESESAFFNDTFNNNNNNNFDWNSFSLNGDYEESRFIFTPPTSHQHSPNPDYMDSQFLQSTPPPQHQHHPQPIPVNISSSTSSLCSSSFVKRKSEEYKMKFRYFIFLFLSTLFVTTVVLFFKRLFKYIDYENMMLDKEIYLYLLVFTIIIGIIQKNFC